MYFADVNRTIIKSFMNASYDLIKLFNVFLNAKKLLSRRLMIRIFIKLLDYLERVLGFESTLTSRK